MKLVSVVLLGAAMVLSAGCGEETAEKPHTTATDGTPTDALDPSRRQAQQLTNEAQEQTEALADKTQEQTEALADDVEKQAVVGSAEKLLSTLGSKIDQWKARAAEAGSSLQGETAQAVQSLAEKKDQLAGKLQALKMESAETWQEVKPDLQAAMEDLKRAYDKVAARVSGESDADASQD